VFLEKDREDQLECLSKKDEVTQRVMEDRNVLHTIRRKSK